jgi:hypothetical protein
LLSKQDLNDDDRKGLKVDLGEVRASLANADASIAAIEDLLEAA